MTADERLAALEDEARGMCPVNEGDMRLGRNILWATTELRKMVEAMRAMAVGRRGIRPLHPASEALDAFEESAETGDPL